MDQRTPYGAGDGDDAVVGQVEDAGGSVERHNDRLSEGSSSCSWLNARHTHPSRATGPFVATTRNQFPTNLEEIQAGFAAQASASRLLYAMGRDSVLPKAVFGRMSEKFHTPVANLVMTGIVGPIAIFLDVTPSTSLINFGAFTDFTLGGVPSRSPAAPGRAPAEPGVLRGGPGDRRRDLCLPALKLDSNAFTEIINPWKRH